jgi:hypothetical protein
MFNRITHARGSTDVSIIRACEGIDPRNDRNERTGTGSSNTKIKTLITNAPASFL